MPTFRFPVLLAAALVAACVPGPMGMAPGGPAAVVPAARVPALTGRVSYGLRTLLDATPASRVERDAAASTAVTLLDFETHTPVASTVTGADGRFTLDLPASFEPAADAIYYVQATKGLGADRPGMAIVRLRTIVKYVGGAWKGLSAGAAQPIDARTTVLAQLLFQGYPIPVDQLFGAYDADTGSFAGLEGAEELEGAVAQVRQSLTGGEDPIRALNFGSEPSRGLDNALVTRVDPPYLDPGGSITIQGLGFGPGTEAVGLDFGDGTPVEATYRGDGFEADVPAAPGEVVRVLLPDGHAAAPIVLPVVARTSVRVDETALRDAALTTAEWPGDRPASMIPLPGGRTYSTDVPQYLVTTAIDRGAGAAPITGAFALRTKVAGAALTYTFQTSADGQVWPTAWTAVDPDGMTAAVGGVTFAPQAGRYLRLRVALLATDTARQPLVGGLAIGTLTARSAFAAVPTK